MAKKAVVSGASRGIGKGIVYALAKEGYDIAFSYATKQGEAEIVAKDLKDKFGVRCFYYQASLQENGVAKDFFDRAVEDLGGLDILVNNAGNTIFQSLQDVTEETMDFLINLDFRTYILMMQYAANYMIRHQVKGNIINITSTRGERAYPGDGIYGGLKAGLNRAIQSFALDVAPYGIRINNVAPGAIRIRSNEECERDNWLVGFWDAIGEKIPMGRSGLPEDIGNAVVFLTSEKASYITGITQRVDGGLILPGMPEE